MGRAPCCDKAKVKKGPWSPEEDAQLKEYIECHGTGGNWISLPQKIGIRRCGKSCRLRWLNYLRPNIKHGDFTDDEDRIICSLFASIGSRWSLMAAQLPGRTDNDIKNHWNTKLKKKLQLRMPSLPYPQIPSQNESCGKSSHYSTHFRANLTDQRINISPFSSFVSPLFPANFVSTSSVQVNRNVFMYGGEGSCNSSDGSCITNQIGHGKEVGHSGTEKLGFFRGFDVGERKAVSDVRFSTEKTMDYSIEDIKQLISSDSTACNNNLMNFILDEVKTEEQPLMYY